MDLNITTAAALMAIISLTAMLAGRTLARHVGTVRTPLFAVLVLLTSLYASSWVGRLENSVIFPIGPVVLISNMTLALVCFLAGFAREIPGVRSLRGTVALSTMVVLGGIFLVAPQLRPLLMPVTLASESRWEDGVCFQTHDASCGPAAAATLLREHGVAADEQEMAALCLTSRAGTEPLALYQGLRTRGSAAGLVPQLASREPEDWTKYDQFPVLAMVAPPEIQFAAPSRTRVLRHLLGRTSDGHAVVVLGRDSNGAYIIGDPAAGRITWDADSLEGFFSGQAIFLQRQGDATSAKIGL